MSSITGTGQMLYFLPQRTDLLFCLQSSMEYPSYSPMFSFEAEVHLFFDFVKLIFEENFETHFLQIAFLGWQFVNEHA